MEFHSNIPGANELRFVCVTDACDMKLQRDGWMLESHDILPCITRDEIRAEREKKKEEERAKQPNLDEVTNTLLINIAMIFNHRNQLNHS